MAYQPRTIAQIQTQIIAFKNAQIGLSGANSPSNVASWNLWIFICATFTAFLEQLWAILQLQIETTVASGVPATALWIQKQVLLFQDGNTIQVNTDLTFGYPLPAFPTPITNASVQTSPSGTVSIKVAQGTYPQSALSAGQLTELGAYLSAILPAGMVPNILSIAADLLQINAVVYYNGQYNSVIQANVNTALNNYMSGLPFNGWIKVSDIEKVILSAQGVTDVAISQITVTPQAAGLNPTNLIAGSTLISREVQAYAGYLINDPGNLFSNTITYSVSNQ